jgi:hypothetical protein
MTIRLTGTHAPAEGTATAPNEVDLGRPTSSLPRFSVEKFWDADSSPPALVALSRAVGALAPKSGARTPQVEAGVVMASLMHDVAYYYGGTSEQKGRADRIFGDQIPYFVSRLNPAAVEQARTTAMVDVAAVAVGGGFPFKESYSWSYGLQEKDRGYITLDRGEDAEIAKVAQQTFREVVNQIADGTFKMSAVLKAKMAKASPEYQQELKANLVKLAKALQAELTGNQPVGIPGF